MPVLSLLKALSSWLSASFVIANCIKIKVEKAMHIYLGKLYVTLNPWDI